MSKKSIALPLLGELQERLAYDPETGLLFWKKSIGKAKAGDIAGSLNTTGYINVGIRGRWYRAHRVAWMLYYGFDPGARHIDHIDGCRSNNRIANLRLIDKRGQNIQNTGIRKDNTTGIKGVWRRRDTKKWVAEIRSDGVVYRLGSYDDPLEAAGRVALARMRLHGEFGRHK